MAWLELSQVGQLFRAKGDNQLAWQGFMIDKTTINGINTQIYGHLIEVLIDTYLMVPHFPQLDIVWLFGTFRKIGCHVDPPASQGS
jgi:hypothetical protein